MATVPYIHPEELVAPALGVQAVVLDADESGKPVKALYVGGAGNVSLEAVNGTSATFSNVPAGTIIPVRVKTVNTASTTATNMVLLLGRFS